MSDAPVHPTLPLLFATARQMDGWNNLQIADFDRALMSTPTFILEDAETYLTKRTPAERTFIAAPDEEGDGPMSFGEATDNPACHPLNRIFNGE